MTLECILLCERSQILKATHCYDSIYMRVWKKQNPKYRKEFNGFQSMGKGAEEDYQVGITWDSFQGDISSVRLYGGRNLVPYNCQNQQNYTA